MYLKLRALMMQNGITVTELAKQIGHDRVGLTLKLTGKRSFKIKDIDKILTFFGKSYDEVFGKLEI